MSLDTICKHNPFQHQHDSSCHKIHIWFHNSSNINARHIILLCCYSQTRHQSLNAQQQQHKTPEQADTCVSGPLPIACGKCSVICTSFTLFVKTDSTTPIKCFFDPKPVQFTNSGLKPLECQWVRLSSFSTPLIINIVFPCIHGNSSSVVQVLEAAFVSSLLCIDTRRRRVLV